ncbi:Olfactory receptor 12D3 Hs6M1-27 [Takifugu flavidus]|uniref:Olfactory receptor 12D3 Hs6M1-27 n=1 Tax=Takifugu flavidus TaxID=433684 RepID=A0A5C6P490_9TELE|nr:Olfactory receptor 12D3 Hs6M1-27 [Takifugu flavidus]
MSLVLLKAFATQLYGTTSHTILIIMAFDRYMAICSPLCYAAIMSHRMTIKLTKGQCPGDMVDPPRMMENFTYNSFILQVEGLTLTEGSVYPAFFLFLFCYLFIIVANVGIATLIFIDSSLHQPMYLLFCNLTFNDILGNSILIPRLLVDSLRPPSERLITYYECVVQAFTTHMFGTTSHTVLMIMAFDRYVAICNPLRYSAIMNHRMVIKLTVSAWAVAFVLVGILLGLTIRLNRCRTLIKNLTVTMRLCLNCPATVW